MKTIILCGGRGYRLKEQTDFKPKPMILIGDKPILWHILKIYSHFGFYDFIIALGYKGEVIKQYFAKNNEFNLTFVDTGAQTLPGERILRLKQYIPTKDKHFMVTYGDGVGTINIKRLLSFHIKQQTIATVTGVHPRSKYGLLEINKQNIVTKFVEKPILKEWVNGGFMVFNKEIFSYFKPKESEHPALQRLVKKHELSLFIHNGFWHAMDTYSDVESLNSLWQTNPAWKVW